jgi:Holliday junction resolvase-like predicted endonuclease
LRVEIEVRLLELTKHGRRLTIVELSDALHVDRHNIEGKVQALSEQGYLTTAGDTIEANAAQRLMLAERLIQTGCDPNHVARHLKWQEFEDFAADSLKQNGFRTVKHFVFKTRNGRREIDLLAWNDNFVLAIDCKHWRRGLSASSARNAAVAQIERVVALCGRPDIIMRRGFGKPAGRKILPVIVSLCDPRESIVEGVPVVAVRKLVSFLYGISPVDNTLRMIPVKAQSEQMSLLHAHM